MTASEIIISKILACRTPLKQLAAEAGVNYRPLWVWVRKRGKSKYDVNSAEAVYKALTGKSFNLEDQTP